MPCSSSDERQPKGRSHATDQSTSRLDDRWCSRSAPAPRTAQLQLNGAGATFPYPMYSKWFNMYIKVDPSVRFNYQSIGSGGGIKQITEQTVDFGAVRRADDRRAAAAAPGHIMHFPTVMGAVVLTYNVEGVKTGSSSRPRPSPASISARSPSGTTRGSPRATPASSCRRSDIIVVHRSDGSGTSYIFTDYLSKVSNEWRRQGRARDVGQLAGRARRQGQRGRHRPREADAVLDRLRRADLRAVQRAAVRRRQEPGRAVRHAVARIGDRGGGRCGGGACRTTSGCRSPTRPAPNAYPISGHDLAAGVPEAEGRREGQEAGAVPQLDDARRAEVRRPICTTRPCRAGGREGGAGVAGARSPTSDGKPLLGPTARSAAPSDHEPLHAAPAPTSDSNGRGMPERTQRHHELGQT